MFKVVRDGVTENKGNEEYQTETDRERKEGLIGKKLYGRYSDDIKEVVNSV